MKYFGTMGLALGLATIAWGQDVVAAKAGLIHYVEGDVAVAGKTLVMKAGDFPEMKKGEELRTDLGRAEILLAPGVFLRVAEKSAFVMHSGKIEDTRLELTAGSMLLEAGEFNPKTNAIVVKVGSNEIEIAKRGLYRIDFEPALIRVYDGSARIVAGGQQVTVGDGRQAALGALPVPQKFNTERTDAFHRWASRRSSYIAVANIAAARKLRDNYSGWSASNWIYNPYLGFFTYIPVNGIFHSPFGWAFYSPRTVERVYYRPPVQVYNPPSSGLGSFGGTRSYADNAGRSSMGSYSSGGVSAPPPAVAAPAAAPAGDGGARSGGDAGGGRSASGGR